MSEKVKLGKLSDIKPTKRNSNKHTAKGMKALDNSMSEDGYVAPMTATADGEIIDGDARLHTAFERLGDDALIIHHDGTKPIVMVRDDIPNADHPMARRIHYRANLTAWQNLDLDPAVVMADIEAGFNFEGIDISLPDLGELLGKAAAELLQNGNEGADTEAEVDRAKALQEKWQVKPGDVWQCDNHFVICGDCREPDTWQRLLAAAEVDKVNGVFTSPPYAEQRKAQYGGVPVAEYVEWWGAVQENVRANLAGDGSFFVNIKPHSKNKERSLYVFDLILAMARRWGWRFIEEFCWKQNGIPGDPKKMGRFKNQFEPIYQFSFGDYRFFPDNVSFESDSAIIDKNYQPGFSRNLQGNGGNPFGERLKGKGLAYPGNVIEAHSNEAFSHQAAFPTALPVFFIKAYSDPGDVWLDPFMGSGTTGVAAHNEGRRALGIERLEKYCAVILERWATHTGQQPQLIAG